jgi:hypothetical protein
MDVEVNISQSFKMMHAIHMANDVKSNQNVLLLIVQPIIMDIYYQSHDDYIK